MKIRVTPLLVVGCAAAWLTGCGGPSPAPTKEQSPAQTATASAPASPKDSAESDGDIKVDLIDADGLEAAVARHKGNVVLVDCWATWCVPCVQGFPKTVALSRELEPQGLRVISLSFDDPTDAETKGKVLEFLKKHDARFENFISRLDLEREGAEAFAIDGGSLPHYKLYDRAGRLVKTFSNSDPDEEFTHEALLDAVKAALADGT